ncbi:hypothetical protein GLOTRDRAFT_109894 [Gloeophyllum trabeum ATCC 11539]|uniref:Uncharacterized protein n=1 Tax=Gloeophyllum trabeum (strain ATCC 11539 / FP-39264 / Madison 617) TaxID=670483 RepID=S7QEP8_GLOTA|nr:uncharacterized protein GLOTRDRAFT_109894 [Gloeophyllum trabeum ATCC 11539]EPQ57773.1 hypothetical protein GLOTRDRAFT_109894 [Gloeophyllum trabeum ATCC 11539]
MNRNMQAFAAHTLRMLLERVQRYTGKRKLMDSAHYGQEPPWKWDRRHPLSDVFLYLDSR